MLNSETATEEWICNRWGGFDYLDIARNEDFSLCFAKGNLTLKYETVTEWGDDILLFENATKQNVIDAERIFGIEIEGK